MNPNRIISLADAIEDAGPNFNIAALLHSNRPELWDHDDPFGSAIASDTIAGIPGWTIILFDPTYLYRQQPFVYQADDIRQRAAHILDLDETQAALLFTPSPNDLPLPLPGHITHYEVADTLRHLADTHTVQWQLSPMWHANRRNPKTTIAA